MANFVQIFIPLVLGYIVMLYFRRRNTEVSLVRSAVDGREYLVQNKPDKQQAADTLARVREKMVKLVEYLKTEYGDSRNRSGGGGGGPERSSQSEQKFGRYEERTQRLVRRFNPDRISEGNEDVRYTTYTLNKGEKVVFCLRARGEGDHVHDLAMMTFVAIHEMAHICSVTEHHTVEWKDNFAWLLRNAVKCGVYQPEDFNARPRRYCGIDVTDTPLSGGGTGSAAIGD